MKILRIMAWGGLAVSVSVRADDPLPPRPWVGPSTHGDHFFKMVPAKMREERGKSVVDREAFGAAYQITEDGKFREIWRTEGWYAFKALLSPDGRYLVRFGPWAKDWNEHTDLAVAFYDKGELIRQYEVRELIRDPDELLYSASHYTWHPQIQTKANGFYGDSFHLVMIDKTMYDFDFKTGEIVARGLDEGAKTTREIRAEERAEAEKKGWELLDASGLKGRFEEHFELSDVEEMRGSYSSCSLEGRTWTANLKPKVEFPHATKVRVVFPIDAGERLVVTITPEDLMAAFKSAFAHPFVMKRFEEGSATGIRLRTQGDRLHWNTPELADFAGRFGETRSGDEDLSHWAYLIIDADEPRYTSIYFNTKNGEILWEDPSAWPRNLHRIGVDGGVIEISKGEKRDR